MPCKGFQALESVSEIQGHYDHSNESHCAELYSFNTVSNAEQQELSGCYFLVEQWKFTANIPFFCGLALVVKCSKILAHIERPFNPRVNKVFIHSFEEHTWKGKLMNSCCISRKWRTCTNAALPKSTKKTYKKIHEFFETFTLSRCFPIFRSSCATTRCLIITTY